MKVRTDRTETGIITSVLREVKRKDKSHYTRWEQVGYTTISKDEDGKLSAEGLYGEALVNSLDAPR